VREAHEVTAALEARRHDQYVLDTYGSLQVAYADYHADLREVLRIYGNEFDVVWPDGKITRGLPKITNYMQLAADDRAREIGATLPSLACRVEKGGDPAKAAAEKRERILGGYWEKNNINSGWLSDLGYNAMKGLVAIKVLPDFREKDKTKRYPCYTILDPLNVYPEPIFTRGPNPHSVIHARMENARKVEKDYGLTLGWSKDLSNTDKVRLIEFYDDTEITVVAEETNVHSGQKKRREIVMQERHEMGRCPVVVSARRTLSGVYMSEFIGGLGVTNTLNRFITMMLDDAYQKVYSPTISYDVENPEEGGPGGHLIKSSKEGTFEWVQAPNQPFTNVQLTRELNASARAANIIPPSRSGDPNESIISAAGISASQSQFVADVRSIQRDQISEAMQAANELAFKADEVWCQPYENGKPSAKPIFSFHSQNENYSPSKDIGGNYRNRVVYGMGSGLDEINQNVMTIQQLQSGLISQLTAMEMSPFVEDPQREKKQMAIEQLDQATFAGLVAQAQQGLLDPRSLASIRRAVESDGTTLADAIETFTQQAPLAPPQPTAPGAANAPGIAGAGEANQPAPPAPELSALLGG
jgi:hypothetical protein